MLVLVREGGVGSLCAFLLWDKRVGGANGEESGERRWMVEWRYGFGC